MNETISITGLFFGLFAVLLGAFGAHGLKRVVAVEAISSFEAGIKYQMYHALFLMLLSMLPNVAVETKNIVFYLVVVGIVLFSGSIYFLATNTLTAFDFKKIGFITPIGGTLLISAWGYLAFSIITKK